MSDYKDQALRSIGRNLVNLQKIEGMLKHFLGSVNFQTPVDQFREKLQENRNKYAKMTLGQLQQAYFGLYDKDIESIHQYPEGTRQKWFSLSLMVENNNGQLPKLEKAFSLLVNERNHLVHEMLVKFKPDIDDECRELIKTLDDQNTRIKVEYKHLQDLLKAFDLGMKKMFNDWLKDSE